MGFVFSSDVGVRFGAVALKNKLEHSPESSTSRRTAQHQTEFLKAWQDSQQTTLLEFSFGIIIGITWAFPISIPESVLCSYMLCYT